MAVALPAVALQPSRRPQAEAGACLLQNVAIGPEGRGLQAGQKEELYSCLISARGGGGCHAQKQVTEAPLQTVGQGSSAFGNVLLIRSSEGPIGTTCVQLLLMRTGSLPWRGECVLKCVLK